MFQNAFKQRHTHKIRTTAAAGTTIGLLLIAPAPSLAATFQYTTLINKAVYTEQSGTDAAFAYDGTFTNTVSNPFSGLEQTFSGFYQIQSGQLGEAVSLSAVQKSPTDRTALGADGITSIEYLATPQPVSTVPGAFSVPPTSLTEFDFKFVPAPVAGAPVVLSSGWVTTTSVPEPALPFSLLGLAGLFLGVNKPASNRRNV